jgi:hypothetical protein
MDRSKEKSGHENKQLVDTVKALIALYKSAFGNDCASVPIAFSVSFAANSTTFMSI